MGSGIGYGARGNCINDFEDKTIDETLSISYMTHDDCSSVFTTLFINGTAVTYSMSEDGDLSIMTQSVIYNDGVLVSNTTSCVENMVETSENGWTTTIITTPDCSTVNRTVDWDGLKYITITSFDGTVDFKVFGLGNHEPHEGIQYCEDDRQETTNDDGSTSTVVDNVDCSQVNTTSWDNGTTVIRTTYGDGRVQVAMMGAVQGSGRRAGGGRRG